MSPEAFFPWARVVENTPPNGTLSLMDLLYGFRAWLYFVCGEVVVVVVGVVVGAFRILVLGIGFGVPDVAVVVLFAVWYCCFFHLYPQTMLDL